MNRQKHSNKQSGSAFIGLIVVMAVVYSGLLFVGTRGWGYMGYGGYYGGPSFMYFGGPNIYGSKNVRDGSVSGPNNKGGGTRAGK